MNRGDSAKGGRDKDVSVAGIVRSNRVSERNNFLTRVRVDDFILSAEGPKEVLVEFAAGAFDARSVQRLQAAIRDQSYLLRQRAIITTTHQRGRVPIREECVIEEWVSACLSCRPALSGVYFQDASEEA